MVLFGSSTEIAGTLFHDMDELQTFSHVVLHFFVLVVQYYTCLHIFFSISFVGRNISFNRSVSWITCI